jgi:NAD-dependent SIR2 family protein deacetylase
MKTTLILGAGFSKNSGIPIQSEIPALLLAPGLQTSLEKGLVEVLANFLKNVFGWNGSGELPALDDIFTCIDISTNSGHHLGISYSPLHLRAIRRFLVYKVFQLLERSFRWNEEVNTLLRGCAADGIETAYVVLNWDTVVERYLGNRELPYRIDYCNGGRSWDEKLVRDNCAGTRIIKLHGSDNWLYCDNCRTLYFDEESVIPVLERAGIRKTDLALFPELKNAGMVPPAKTCHLCGNEISSHIATFSYRKSFRANSFPNLWKEAEETLSASDRWVFIGYSLPEADYEFKHLLKIAQLKLGHKKKEKLRIDVVLLGSDTTSAKYRSFFGDYIGRIYNGGIREYIDDWKTNRDNR